MTTETIMLILYVAVFAMFTSIHRTCHIASIQLITSAVTHNYLQEPLLHLCLVCLQCYLITTHSSSCS